MDDLTLKRLMKLKRYCTLLQALPFIRAIVLNGSLAIGPAQKTSDIDLLVITQSQRIFTARFLVNSVLTLSRQKRPSNENKAHSGKFCPNYFLNESFLKIPTGRSPSIDLYCANNYSRAILITGEQTLFSRFKKINNELFNKADGLSQGELKHQRKLKVFFPVKERAFVQIAKHFLERILAGWFGDRVEKKLKLWQIRKIEKDSRTRKYPNLIVFNDDELRFHPPSGKF